MEWGPSMAAPMWALWHETRGEKGEEPPPEMKRALAVYDEIVVAADEEKRAGLTMKMPKICAENFWVGAICRRPGKMLVINNDVRNVPEYLFAGSWDFEGPGNACQYFFKR